MNSDERIILGASSAVTGDSQVNFILKEAVRRGASDIHIEPLEKEVIVRFRVDGVLEEAKRFPKDDLEHITNHLKVLCNLEVGSVRLPEDGHFSTELQEDDARDNQMLDVRVSIFPSLGGPASVLRLLNRSEMLISLDDIFVDEKLRNQVRQMTLSSYGMVLTTGPTGSGKTTTLYAMLMEIKRKERNIMTLEDPVEMYFEDMRQSQINPEIGFTFAKGMKSILRQDPDTIMIGEIRDGETAEYAVQASLTGRLVYSTLHANTTIGGVARLIDMDIDRGLIAYAIRGLIAQRLVRKICSTCSVVDEQPRAEYIDFLGLSGLIIPYRKGAGCAECDGTGYRGRAGIFEILTFDDNLRALIVDKASMSDLQAYAEKAGMLTLRQNAIGMVSAGITTLDEIVRVV